MIKDDFMEIAWRDFILWAFSQPDIVARFEAETGKRMPAAAKSGLDLMIDQATGIHENMVAEFTRWATVNLWGLDDAPESYRAEIGAAQ